MKVTGKNKEPMMNTENSHPNQSFYSLPITLNNGDVLSAEKLRGKKVLVVNTASNCGYTAQYADLQKLHEQHKDKLVVIGFPANDFKEQEKGSDEEINQFCTVNFGVTFMLGKKSSVVKGAQQNLVYQWLTNKEANGWNDQPPTWNFAKFLINEKGVLTHYFEPSISPLSNEVLTAITN
jgi:glutathione peroxidase